MDHTYLYQHTPRLSIIRQPASHDVRYRYASESNTFGGPIPGVDSTPEKPTFPTIKLEGYTGRARVMVSCVTRDAPYKAHPHRLKGTGCKRGVCILDIPPNSGTVEFTNLGIECVRKADIKRAFNERKEDKVDPFNEGFSHSEKIDLNIVRLCFQVLLENTENTGQFLQPITELSVVSQPIYDKKVYPELVIKKLSHRESYVDGGKEDIILLCERVSKDDIELWFYEKENGQRGWTVKGDIIEVYKNHALWFRTPKYKTNCVEKPVKVFVKLRRPKDSMTSNAMSITLLPSVDAASESLWGTSQQENDLQQQPHETEMSISTIGFQNPTPCDFIYPNQDDLVVTTNNFAGTVTSQSWNSTSQPDRNLLNRISDISEQQLNDIVVNPLPALNDYFDDFDHLVYKTLTNAEYSRNNNFGNISGTVTSEWGNSTSQPDRNLLNGFSDFLEQQPNDNIYPLAWLSDVYEMLTDAEYPRINNEKNIGNVISEKMIVDGELDVSETLQHTEKVSFRSLRRSTVSKFSQLRSTDKMHSLSQTNAASLPAISQQEVKPPEEGSSSQKQNTRMFKYDKYLCILSNLEKLKIQEEVTKSSGEASSSQKQNNVFKFRRTKSANNDKGFSILSSLEQSKMQHVSTLLEPGKADPDQAVNVFGNVSNSSRKEKCAGTSKDTVNNSEEINNPSRKRFNNMFQFPWIKSRITRKTDADLGESKKAVNSTGETNNSSKKSFNMLKFLRGKLRD